jgi:VanZ family protein
MLLWAPVIAYAAAIFAASSISDPSMPGGLSDTTLHGWVYAGLSALILRALARGRRRGVTARRAFLAAVLAAAYGLSDEIHQVFVPGRVFDTRDLMANAVGAAAAAVVGYVVGRAGWRARGPQEAR